MEPPGGNRASSLRDRRALIVSVAVTSILFRSFLTSLCPAECPTATASSKDYEAIESFCRALPCSEPSVLLCSAAPLVSTNHVRFTDRRTSKPGTPADSGGAPPDEADHSSASQYNARDYASIPRLSGTGGPRRLTALLGRTVRRLVVWQPVERNLPSINLDKILFVAGDHRADRSSAFRATVEDVLTLFFRWFDAEGHSCVWPLQGMLTMEALKRAHKHYGQQMVRDFSKKQQELREDESTRMSRVRSVEFYTQLGAVQRRITSWFFDGNTFHRRGREAFAIPQNLKETDVEFLRGLPFNLLHVAHAVYAPEAPAAIRRLEKELALRGVDSVSTLLSKTTFFDLFVLLDILDESLAQIDVLREYVSNWQRFTKENLKPADIPLGSWKEKQSLQDYMTDPRRPRSEFPACSTLKCTMRYSWRKTPPRNIVVAKEDVNTLKLLLVGSTGVASLPTEEGAKGWVYRLKRFFSMNAFEKTVQAMKAWHQKEKADAVLGLGDILGFPGPRSVHDELFETKWYRTFVEQGGLDVPWLMILGDADAMLSPSTQIRYHYLKKRHNWHMPNEYYTVNFQFGANLTLADGTIGNEQFNATVINLSTWDLLPGNPLADNMEGWTHKLHWLSEQLYTAAQTNSTWVLVTGHHPVISTGPEGEQARLQYVLELYKTGRPRGVESRLVQLLFLHYHVDAYISAHDYLMEYTALKEKDTGVTVSFISSGAGARLLHSRLGHGWIGRLRGALYPALCWAGRKLLYSLNPGGCDPLWRDRDQPQRFYAPSHDLYEVDVVERITRKHGFVALKLSKDSMVVDFIDSASGKPAARSVHRKPNRPARAARFLDPYAAGKVKYEELLVDREVFARENSNLIEKEVQFYRRCPVLAERITLCIKEINEIVDIYEELAQQKEGYETMDDSARDLMMAQGVNVLAKTSQILGQMYTLSNEYQKIEQLYKKLLEIKQREPAADNPRWKDLLDLEKRYATSRRRKRELTARLNEVEGQPDPQVEKELNEEIKLLKLLRKEMDDIEAGIQKDTEDATKPKDATGSLEQRRPSPEKEKPSPLVTMKPLDTSVEARIERKEALLQRHIALLEELVSRPDGEVIKLKPEIEILKRQTAYIRQDLTRLRQLHQRSQSPMLPSRVWEKFKVKQDLETRLRHMKAYLFRVSKLPSVSRFSSEVEADVETVETEKAHLEAELTEVVDELRNRELTPLQALYLATETELLRNRQVAQLRYRLSASELDMPGVEAALKKAEEKERVLEGEVEKLREQVMEELDKLDLEWRRQNAAVDDTGDDVVIGPDVEQLSVGEASKVLETGEITQAAATLQLLESTKEYVRSLQEAVGLIRTSSPEEVKEIESQWGPVGSLGHKLSEARKRVNELEETVRQMELQLERDAPVGGDQAQGTGGASARHLGEMTTWFKEKREASPYKKLVKIDVGQVDPCMQMPFLEAAVKRVLEPKAESETKDDCVYELANQVYREQHRYIHAGVFFSQTDTGMMPALFDSPSAHVERAYSAYFGYTRLTRFKSILREIRDGLDWIHQQIAFVSLQDLQKREVQNLGNGQEEEKLSASELEMEWLEDEVVDNAGKKRR